MYHISLKYTKYLMVIVAMMASCFLAQANNETANKINKAKQLTTEGRAAYNKHDYKIALEKFETAWIAICDVEKAEKYQEYVQKHLINTCLILSKQMFENKQYNDVNELLCRIQEHAPNDTRLYNEIVAAYYSARNANKQKRDEGSAQSGSQPLTICKMCWPNVPREFFEDSSAASNAPADDDDPWVSTSSTSNKKSIDEKGTFISCGVPFPQGASVHYSKTGLLTMYNTEENIDLSIDAINDYCSKRNSVQLQQESANIQESNEESILSSEIKKLTSEGRAAYDAHDYKLALEKYLEAFNILSHTKNTSKYLEHSQKSCLDAGFALSEEMIKDKRYNDAHDVLFSLLLLEEQYNPQVVSEIADLHKIERDDKKKQQGSLTSTFIKKSWTKVPRQFFINNSPVNTKKTLVSLGVDFPQKAYCTYETRGVLTVFNTEENIDRTSKIIDDYLAEQVAKQNNKEKSSKKKK